MYIFRRRLRRRLSHLNNKYRVIQDLIIQTPSGTYKTYAEDLSYRIFR